MIEIIKEDITSLKSKLNNAIKEQQQLTKVKEPLPLEIISDIKNTLSDISIQNLLRNIKDIEYFNRFDYAALSDLEDLFKELNNNIGRIKQKVDVEIFLKEGYRIDEQALIKKFKKAKLHKEFPNFNIKKLSDLYKSPPPKLAAIYDNRKQILIDKFVFRKYLIAIIQMIFNHMDLLVCASGGEGVGKSTLVSQHMYLVYWILKSIGVIDYEWDIKEIWFNNLPQFREAEDKYFSKHFRIFGLDEGNELNRQDWKDDEVKTFFQRLRRERYNRRIKFICLPVLGELIPNIVLSRMNFIFDLRTKNEISTATLKKGIYDFYIIPRGSTIYSPKYKKEFTATEIRQKLYVNMKDKEYLKGMPRDIIVKTCQCNGTWGFKETEYVKELKESNKTYSVSRGITFGYTELYMFYKSTVTMKKLGIKANDIRYPSMHKMINKINHYFYSQPDLMQKMESMFIKKQQDKEARAK